MEKGKVPSPFTNVIQVGIVVKDIDQAAKRLTALGIGPFESRTLAAGRKEWFRGKPMDAEMKISMAKMGEVDIELIQPVSGDSPHKEFLNTKGEGIQHIACRVEDLETHIANLTENGATVLLRAKWPEGGGVAYMDLGVAGLVVELIERGSIGTAT
jgi:methylmalonyl-CoA/ethylmalonyl-CoA epimerase